MRSTAENERIHQLATALLKRRGVQPSAATYEQYAEAASIAAEAVARGKTTVAEMLAVAAVGDGTPEPKTFGVLAKFASDGKFVADLSLDEEEFLRAVIAAEGEDSTALLDETARCPHGYEATPGGSGKADGCPYC